MNSDDATPQDLDNPSNLPAGADTPVAPAYLDPLDELPHGTQSLQGLFDAPADYRFLGMESFGNYRLLEKIGQGGSGVVFRAIHQSTREIVAVKILRPELLHNQSMQLRFRKEARLHSEISSPYITRQIEFGQEGDYFFIVSEFIDGVSLREILDSTSRQGERGSLLIIRDVLHALDALHSRGIVHRDVKPENILLMTNDQQENGFEFQYYVMAKLTDFGLARHIEQSESMEMTRQQAVLGTPLYLAPEQHSASRDVDSRADIYSLGATLFHMLCGRPPFDGGNMLELAEQHRSTQPRLLSEIRSELSGAISTVVAKSLAKEPAFRYANAAEMLQDIQRILDGKPVAIPLFPHVPDSDPKKLRKFDFIWELDCSTTQLWPFVADTDRFNKAIGLPAPQYQFAEEDDGRQIFATARFSGMKVRWREHPFHWIEGREMSILREFESGPFVWVSSKVELAPLANGKTRLVHRFQVLPRGWLGQVLTHFQFKYVLRRAIGQVYQRMESLAANTQDPLACAATYGKPVAMPKRQKMLLKKQLDTLLIQSHDADVLFRFADFLSTAADSSVMRIRPIPMATRLRCDVDEFLTIALQASKNGLLVMMWDVICPVCRIAAATTDSIKEIRNHMHCQACNLNFPVDFGRSVELVFRVHPNIRDADSRTYCIGGPYHLPHVVAQVTLKPEEQLDIGLNTDEAKFIVGGPQLPWQKSFFVNSESRQSRLQLDLFNPRACHDLQTGFVCVQLGNSSDQKVLARLERAAPKHDMVTASDVSQNPLFQKLFPQEILAPGDLVALSSCTMVFAKIFGIEGLVEEIGEVSGRVIVKQIRQTLSDASQTSEIESTFGSSLVVFEKLADAIAACQRCYRFVTDHQAPLSVGFAVHAGEILIGTRNSQADVFGKTVRTIHELADRVERGQTVATTAIFETDEFQEFSRMSLDAVETPQQTNSDTIRIFRFRAN